MLYLDTSVLIPLLVREAVSDEVRNWFESLPQSELTISDWTYAEFVSAIGLKVRMRELSKDIAKDTIRAFRRLADESFVMLTPAKADFLLSSQFLERFELGLRAADALHLAIAANHGAKRLYSLDRTLIKGAEKLKIKAQIPV